MASWNSNYSYGARSRDSGGRSAVVYTDGSCVSNGQAGARGGIGVYWGQGDARNVSEPLSQGRQTNNRAEITAATKAVEQARDSGISDLTIRTDSRHLTNSMTDWMPNWKQNGWTTSSGNPVINRQELQELDSAISGGNMNVQFEHVKGHAGVQGNEEANRLATRGARW